VVTVNVHAWDENEVILASEVVDLMSLYDLVEQVYVVTL